MAETIGQQLQQVRESKGIPVSRVVQATRIREQYILALEADDFDRLPSPVQARAFLRLYAEFLGLEVGELIARQKSASQSDPASPPEPSPQESTAATPDLQETTGQSGSVPGRWIGSVRQAGLGVLARLKALRKSPLPVEAEQPADVVDEPVLQMEAQDLPVPEEENIHERLEADPGEVPASTVILQGIGQTLRQRRETLSLTLDEIEQHTRVRKHYLSALEEGNLTLLPSSVQARGMLSNYAHFLDLNTDAILLQFAEALQQQRLERQRIPAGQNGSTPTARRFRLQMPAGLVRYLSLDILAGAGLVLVLLTFSIWGISRVIRTQSAAGIDPTAPSISDILAATPELPAATPSPTSGNGAAPLLPAASLAVEITLPAEGEGPVQVVVVALDSAWVRVTVDGRIEFEGRTTAGIAYPYNGNTQIEVLTGDGASTGVIYNQSDLGPMGNYGDVVDRIYTVNAILNPTPTFTMTPSVTPVPSATPRPSSTPRPSATVNP
jgi:cytoskeletal protein RodZ